MRFLLLIAIVAILLIVWRRSKRSANVVPTSASATVIEKTATDLPVTSSESLQRNPAKRIDKDALMHHLMNIPLAEIGDEANYTFTTDAETEFEYAALEGDATKIVNLYHADPAFWQKCYEKARLGEWHAGDLGVSATSGMMVDNVEAALSDAGIVVETARPRPPWAT